MKYLLDTNVLIEAKNGFYAFDLCPGFWDWLKTYQNMRSIQMVRNEIMNGGDFLSEWVSEELPADYFLAEDEAVQREYQKVAAYIVGLADFSEEKKDVFLDQADGWLIAAAVHHGASVVTHESFDQNCKRKILLPVIAQHFNVPCVKIFHVLRDEKVCFKQ